MWVGICWGHAGNINICQNFLFGWAWGHDGSLLLEVAHARQLCLQSFMQLPLFMKNLAPIPPWVLGIDKGVVSR